MAERQLTVGPAHLQALVGQVDLGFGYCRQGAQVALDQPAAGGAADALDQQAGFGQFPLMLHVVGLHIRTVIQLQFIAQLAVQGFGVAGILGAVTVVAVEPAGNDGLGNRLAARTAEGPRLIEHAGLKPAAGWDRQTAMKARGGAVHRSINQ